MDRVDQDIQVSHITVLLRTKRCALKEVCVKLQACLFDTQKGDLVLPADDWVCTCDKMPLRCVQWYSLLHVSKRWCLVSFPVCEDNGGLFKSDLARRYKWIKSFFSNEMTFLDIPDYQVAPCGRYLYRNLMSLWGVTLGDGTWWWRWKLSTRGGVGMVVGIWRDGRRNIWTKLLKETNLGVTRVLFDSKKISHKLNSLDY